jgi:mono/diheme cytochrome c family protein
VDIRGALTIGLTALLVTACDSGEDPKSADVSGDKSRAESVQVAPASQPAANSGTKVAALKTPKKAVSPPQKRDPSAVKLGKSLYEENCVGCHQEDAIGQPGIAPSLTNPELLEIASDAFFINTIREGREDTGMPPFEHLGEKEIVAIVAFLRDHSDRPNRSAEVDAQPEAHGDPRLGEQWFRYVCATCHGKNGEGYLSEGTGTAIGKPGFLSKASDGFIRTTIKVGRSNTRMRGFSGSSGLANLSDQEIDDIIVFLRTLSTQ